MRKLRKLSKQSRLSSNNKLKLKKKQPKSIHCKRNQRSNSKFSKRIRRSDRNRRVKSKSSSSKWKILSRSSQRIRKTVRIKLGKYFIHVLICELILLRTANRRKTSRRMRVQSTKIVLRTKRLLRRMISLSLLMRSLPTLSVRLKSINLLSYQVN